MLYKRMVSDSRKMDYTLKVGDIVRYSGAHPKNTLFEVRDLTWSYDCAALQRLRSNDTPAGPGSISVAPIAELTKVKI